MVNKVILVGVITRLDGLQETDQGKQFLHFTVTTAESWEVEGVAEESPELHTCVLWGQPAEKAARYLAVGRLVYIEGKLHAHTWLDELQRVYRRTEVVVLTYRFLADNPVSTKDRPPV